MRELLTCCALLWTTLALAAPARPARPVQPWTASRANLIGTWSVRWTGVDGQMDFRADGTYQHRHCGTTWEGSWGVKDGKLWVTESDRPEDATRWRTFSVRLGPDKKGKAELWYREAELVLVEKLKKER